MATIKTIKMFDENGILTPEALLIINDSAFLAGMAYKNREKLKEVSLNPDAKDDEIIIIQNPHIGTKFEVVEVYEGSYGLNLSTFKKEGSSEYFFAGARTDDRFDYIADALYLLSGKNIQSAEAISYMQSKIKETRIP